MAPTSRWRVNGWLGKVVIYVENPEKTANPKFYTTEDMTEQDGQGLSDVIRYAVNSEKTQQTDNENCAVVHSFVSGVNCSPSTARGEMLAVKKRFGKENGTVAYHGYQSFAPGEATPEIAHEIGMKLAARLWGDRYQVIVATHLDKENHLHNHFVLNTVSFVDGIKYKAHCISYILGKQFGFEVSDYNFGNPSESLRTDDPQEIRAELSEIRDTAYDISARMVRSLEKEKAPRNNEQER